MSDMTKGEERRGRAEIQGEIQFRCVSLGYLGYQVEIKILK